MKKTYLILVLFIATCSLASAQELGVRFGNASVGNVSVDGIFSLGKFSRVHADVSFGSGVGVDALWDFLYKPLNGEAINWYLGAGPYMGFQDPFLFGVAGEAGLEYHFNGIPLALGIDWRPRLQFVNDFDFGAEGFGVNVRYVFGKK